jgi:uncharacterized protein
MARDYRVCLTHKSSHRMLIVWFYDRTESLLVAKFMVLSVIIGTVLFVPVEIGGAPGVIWSLVITAALWVVVAAVLCGQRREA